MHKVKLFTTETVRPASWKYREGLLHIPSLPRSSIRVFITFLLLGEVGAALVTLSFALFSGMRLWTFSKDEISAVLPLLTSDESALGGAWLIAFSAILSSFAFGLFSFSLSISKLFFSGTEDLLLCLSRKDFLLGGSGDARFTASLNSSSSSEKSKTTLLFLLPSPLEALLKLKSSPSSSLSAASTASWTQIWASALETKIWIF